MKEEIEWFRPEQKLPEDVEKMYLVQTKDEGEVYSYPGAMFLKGGILEDYVIAWAEMPNKRRC